MHGKKKYLKSSKAVGFFILIQKVIRYVLAIVNSGRSSICSKSSQISWRHTRRDATLVLPVSLEGSTSPSPTKTSHGGAELLQSSFSQLISYTTQCDLDGKD